MKGSPLKCHCHCWTAQDVPYAHCAWCVAQFRVLGQLEHHYLSNHNVVLQASCCSSPSVFQTVMWMELQLRQSNFGSYSTEYAQLREDITYDTVREIIRAYCITRKDDTKDWLMKLPDLKAGEDSFLVYSPSVTCVPLQSTLEPSWSSWRSQFWGLDSSQVLQGVVGMGTSWPPWRLSRTTSDFDL